MMDLVRWNPWRDMMDLQKRINNIFEETFVSRTGEKSNLFNWNPAVDVYEEGDNLVIKAELPGVNKDDIEIDVKETVLTLKGERSAQNEVKEDKYYRRERSYGKFMRSFTLPAHVDPEKITADFKDGILNITITKPEKEKVKKVSIS